jgi:hypothetical protein
MTRIGDFGDLMVALNGSQVKLSHVLGKLYLAETTEQKAKLLEEVATLLREELSSANSNLTRVSGEHAHLSREKYLAEQYMRVSDTQIKAFFPI